MIIKLNKLGSDNNGYPYSRKGSDTREINPDAKKQSFKDTFSTVNHTEEELMVVRKNFENALKLLEMIGVKTYEEKGIYLANLILKNIKTKDEVKGMLNDLLSVPDITVEMLYVVINIIAHLSGDMYISGEQDMNNNDGDIKIKEDDTDDNNEKNEYDKETLGSPVKEHVDNLNSFYDYLCRKYPDDKIDRNALNGENTPGCRFDACCDTGSEEDYASISIYDTKSNKRTVLRKGGVIDLIIENNAEQGDVITSKLIKNKDAYDVEIRVNNNKGLLKWSSIFKSAIPGNIDINSAVLSYKEDTGTIITYKTRDYVHVRYITKPFFINCTDPEFNIKDGKYTITFSSSSDSDDGYNKIVYSEEYNVPDDIEENTLRIVHDDNSYLNWVVEGKVKNNDKEECHTLVHKVCLFNPRFQNVLKL